MGENITGRKAMRKVRSEMDLSSCATDGKQSPLTGSIMTTWAVSYLRNLLKRPQASSLIYCVSPLLPHHFCRISYSLAHSNIALLLHAKLTPQVLPYLLTDTCSVKMIPSPAASIGACSGGVLGSIIKLKKRDRVRGLGFVGGVRRVGGLTG